MAILCQGHRCEEAEGRPGNPNISHNFTLLFPSEQPNPHSINIARLFKKQLLKIIKHLLDTDKLLKIFFTVSIKYMNRYSAILQRLFLCHPFTLSIKLPLPGAQLQGGGGPVWD